MAEEKKENEPAFHPFWSGTIAFGLVSVPVQLFPANRHTRMRVRMIDQDGTPIRRHYFCPKDQRDIHPEHIVRGYEVSEGDYVVVREDELRALEPKKSREIDLRQFVPREEISRAYFERAYYLTPAGESTKAYRLLADVIESSGLVGIATFVMRDREYLIAILAEHGVLQAVTLRFHDELRSPEALDLPEKGKRDAKAVSAFERAIKKHSSKKLAIKEMKDEYGELLRALVEKKFKRKHDIIEVQSAEPEENKSQDEESEEGEPADLLETIRRSLHAGDGKSRRRRPTK
jgi:DNA end-binding protein Ku